MPEFAPRNMSAGDPFTECTACHGHEEILCTDCNGTGRDAEDWDCMSCDGAGETRCTVCQKEDELWPLLPQ